MNPSSSTLGLDSRVLLVGGAACLLVGLASLTWIVLRAPSALPYRLWARYVTFLEAKLRLMFVPTKGRTIALVQVGVLMGLIVVNVVAAKQTWTFPAMAMTAGGPTFYIDRMLIKRKRAIETQLNGFALALSNALKVTPSLAAAFQTMAALTAEPFQSEIAYAVKAMRLGASLDQALLIMASRIGSQDFDMLASSLLIGRNVGGDLPTILDTTAASMREMSRLEQLVRSKTAEGRAQLWVLAIFPLVLIIGLGSLMPGYFDVFSTSLVGISLAALSAILWVSSILVARRIVDVHV